MRTTLSLDDDVAALLARVQREEKATLKDVVNAALRHGLTAMQRKTPPAKRFHTKTLVLGKCYLPNLDNIAEALAIAEGEDHR